MAASGPELLRAFERQIADDKATHLKGWARVRISHLIFPDPIRQKDKRLIAQLKRNISAEGCHDEEHPIPAIIDDRILQIALSQAGIQAESLRNPPVNPPKVKFFKDTKLECLEGQHRALAAKQILPSAERWWTIELYGKGLSNNARQSLRDGYSYSANYTDGEIFRHVRRCQLAGDRLGERRWRARYSPTKERDLKQLLNRKILLDALDSILPVRGLWGAFHVGSLDIFLTSRFDEEIAHYIGCIKDIWSKSLGNDTLLMECTDEFTVGAIQLRAPALSKYDAEFIQNQMESKRLFPEIRDLSVRQGITTRLLAIETPIPTIYSLFKNLRYLLPALGMIRDLIPKKVTGTLREALYFHFSEAGSTERTLEIQVSERSYSTFSGSVEQFFDLAVRQLYLYAIRHSAKPSTQRVDIYSKFGLAELAEKSGFSSEEIDSILKNDPYQRVVLDLVHRIVPTQTPADIQIRTQPTVRELRELVDALSNITVERSTPWGTVAGLGEPLSRRCGPSVWTPSDHDDMGGGAADLNHIFLDQMHIPLARLPKGGGGISSFYVKRSIYLAFFGILPGGKQLNTRPANTPRETHGNTAEEGTYISHRAHQVERSAAPASGSGEGASNSNELSHGPVTSQVIPFGGRVITFIEDNIPIREVPFEKERINYQAREYADQGKKLHVAEGAHFIWQHCFDVLTRTRSSTVFVSTIVQPVHGKRRRDQGLPDRLQPATKEAYDFAMTDEDDEIL